MQNTKRTDLNCLKLQLAEFGLRPDDWTLRKEKSDELVIENISEPEFQFGGITETRKGETVWQKIFLRRV